MVHGVILRFKGAISLLYQVFFYAIIILIVGLLIGVPLSKDMIKVFYFGGFYWFIPAYLCLYVMSPILNTYIEFANRSQLILTIIAFFVLEFIYGWITDMGAYNEGYSAISFIGLYMLARYVNKYSPYLKSIKPIVGGCYFIILTLIPVILAFFGLKYTGHAFSPIKYCSPFVVLAALCLFLTFQGMTFKNRFVNWVAASVFSVYIIHLNPMVVPYFKELMCNAYHSLNGFLYCMFAIGVAVFLCVACSVIDRLRMMSWSGFTSFFSRRINPSVERLCRRIFKLDIS